MKKIVSVLLTPTLCIIVLALFWEFMIHDKAAVFLSKPSMILKAFKKQQQVILSHAKVTFFEMGVSWFSAALISIPLGYFMYVLKWVRRSFQPIFILIQCMPMFTLAPIMLILFGWGKIAIIIPTMLMIFFPMTISVFQGMQAMPKIFHAYATLHQASPIKKYFKLQFPFSIPHLFNGLKVSTAISGVGAIAGEWAGAQRGLGIYMIECRRNMDFHSLYASIITLVALTFIFYSCVTLAEQILKKRNYV